MSGALAEAERQQLLASDPAVSAFVAASAGSGKTKLLTDRLLRLMLGGADPARIQCLTFTKAAAAEMAVRLQTRLGAWVTMPEARLVAELAQLDVAPGEAARARALFAEVLDIPGGMRIGTIHAFCQSLLKRFPLEARLSPHFALIDDTDAAMALTEAREAMLAHAAEAQHEGALEALAGIVGAEAFSGLVTTLMADRARLLALQTKGVANIAAAQVRLLHARDEADILRDAVTWPEAPELRAALQRIAAKDTKIKRAHAHEVMAWLALPTEARIARWDDWMAFFLKQDGDPRSITHAFISKTFDAADPTVLPVISDEMDRIGLVQDARQAAAAARLSAALITLGLPVATGYAARKALTGKLDYEDLIAHTSALLVDPGAAWVLFKLDGGLDHLLLDEVQDTAPAQWRIAAALTAEFFAGQGARETLRTVFAVGDRKQSIYSFQGADPDSFAHWRQHLRAQVTASGGAWEDVPLQVSFRSTAPVLALVDAVFAAPDAADGVVEPGEVLAHHAVRAGQAGCVELWPLAPKPDEATPDPWLPAWENAGQISAERQLSEALAEHIRLSIGRLRLQSRDRMLQPGDVLVLVRRRNELGRALVRALKARGVPVAGLDRMKLTDQPAVADLLALCDALLLPQDDLQLACVLTSPLGGLSDDSLMALAIGRKASLWEALRGRAAEQADWQTAHRMLAVLLAKVDFIPPHALLSEALGPLGGRARLFARLGPEAAEPVDELLAKALDHAATHPPSLQGFVHWLRQSSAEVKREADGAGGAVRIMTVHGAKGLQAPLVILPDTTALPPDRTSIVWAEADGVQVPIWAPGKRFASARIDAWKQAARAAEMREQNRLLYVALTRAEDRLIVCGWQTGKVVADECWYRQVERGFHRLATTAETFAPWDGEMLVHEAPQNAAPDRVDQRAERVPPPPLPGWAGSAPAWRPTPPPAEPALPSPLAPSRPEGAEFGATPGAATPLAARDTAGLRFRRGQLLHALLQHLPSLPRIERAPAARRYLASPAHGLSAAAVDSVLGEVLAVLDHPALAPIFAPEGRAEVPLTGVVAGRVVGGLVDRVAVLADRVLFVDYKTNRDAPEDVAAVPVAYLRQMAAYRAVLAGAYPGREVVGCLVWTLGARVMPLPNALLDRHAPGAA
jgi:ATP-dependent helicase/nuclease subunit A